MASMPDPILRLEVSIKEIKMPEEVVDIPSPWTRIKQGPPTQAHYEQLVTRMASLRMRKVKRYGEARYNDPSLTHAMTLLYADLYRKFIRIQNAIVGDNQSIGELDVEDGEGMVDTLLDMANYALMGVQLIEVHNANGTAQKVLSEDGEPVEVTSDPQEVKNWEKSLHASFVTHNERVTNLRNWVRAAIGTNEKRPYPPEVDNFIYRMASMSEWPINSFIDYDAMRMELRRINTGNEKLVEENRLLDAENMRMVQERKVQQGHTLTLNETINRYEVGAQAQQRFIISLEGQLLEYQKANKNQKDTIIKLQEELKVMYSRKPSPEGLVFDQVAITTRHPEAVKTLLANIFGKPLTWTDDTVVASGTVGNYNEQTNRAELSYNYELIKHGVEFEILEYTDGRNWLEGAGNHFGTTEVSHFGMHVEDLELVKERLKVLGLPIIQEVDTVSHTNPKIKDSRRYHYVIYDTKHVLGFYLKLIQRVDL